MRWRRPTGVPLTGDEERALSEEHAVLTGKYEREAEDLTELNRLYELAAATGMEVVIEDDGIPEDLRYHTPRESPAERGAREEAERAARAYEFELSQEDLSR